MHQCEFCDEKEVEIVVAQNFQSDFCNSCFALVVYNDAGEEIDSSEVPLHLQNVLLN